MSVVQGVETRRERFEQVFDAHFRAVSAYALRRATRAEAEDAVAETFMVAWRRLDDVPDDAATALACTRTAVKVRLHRARRRLRAELQRLERGEAARVMTARRLKECHEE